MTRVHSFLITLTLIKSRNFGLTLARAEGEAFTTEVLMAATYVVSLFVYLLLLSQLSSLFGAIQFFLNRGLQELHLLLKWTPDLLGLLVLREAYAALLVSMWGKYTEGQIVERQIESIRRTHPRVHLNLSRSLLNTFPSLPRDGIRSNACETNVHHRSPMIVHSDRGQLQPAAISNYRS